jgi:hypothetical protein
MDEIETSRMEALAHWGLSRQKKEKMMHGTVGAI